MKEKKKLVLAVVALILVAAVALGIYFTQRPQGKSGGKDIVVEVVHKNGEHKDFEVNTDEEYLGNVLVSEGIVEDNQTEFGLYILTADGYTVDENAQEWWCVTVNGVMSEYGADALPIEDGGHYELTLTVGW